MPSGKLHSCVKKVIAQGKGKSSAYAICMKTLKITKLPKGKK